MRRGSPPPHRCGPAPAHRASGSRPNRSCRASQPSTQPGTVAERTSSIHRHRGHSRSAHGRRVGPRTSPADCDQRGGRGPAVMDKCKEVTAHAAHVLGGDGQAPRWCRLRHRLHCRRRGAAQHRPTTRDGPPSTPFRGARGPSVRHRVASWSNGNASPLRPARGRSELRHPNTARHLTQSDDGCADVSCGAEIGPKLGTRRRVCPRSEQ